MVFAQLDLAVQWGEMVAIVGESGSGKSTLLHLLSGLDRPSAGDVYFDSDKGPRSLAAMEEEELAELRNREIGFVWQQHYLLPEFTALENVMMPLLIGGQPPAAAESTSRAWLDRVGLSPRASHRSGELSGGEQQRVALARALVGDPSFLMADEPTGNLDAATGAAVFELIRRLHSEQQGARKRFASIIVTHNLHQAQSCDRVVSLMEGQLQEQLQPGIQSE